MAINRINFDIQKGIKPDSSKLYDAIATGKLEEVKRLVNESNVNNTLDIESNIIPLHVAVMHAEPEIILFLLECKANINAKTTDEYMAIDYAVQCYLSDEKKYDDKKRCYLDIILLLIKKNAKINHFELSENLIKITKINPHLKKLIENRRELNNCSIDAVRHKAELEYAIGLNYTAIDIVYITEGLNWFEKAASNNHAAAMKQLKCEAGLDKESKTTPQRTYNALMALGRVSLHNSIRSETSITHAFNYFLSAQSIIKENKDIIFSPKDKDFFDVINTRKLNSENILIDMLKEDVKECPVHLHFLYQLNALAEVSHEALLFMLFYMKHGSLEEMIVASYFLHRFPSHPYLTECKHPLYEDHKPFIQGIRELYGLEGHLVNEGKAIVNFKKCIAKAIKENQIEYEIQARLYIVECHRRLAAKEVLKKGNPEERLLLATEMHMDIQKKYANLSLSSRNHIFFSIFNLLETAIDKRSIINIFLNTLQKEIDREYPNESLLKNIFDTLLTKSCVTDIHIWRHIIDKLNACHTKSKNLSINVLFIAQLTQLKNMKTAQDSDHQYYVERALGDCHSRVHSREALAKAIQHYDVARKNQLSALSLADEKFTQQSYRNIYKQLGDAITQLRTETKDPRFAETLRKEAIDTYNTAALLGNTHATLEAAKLIELDGEGTDEAIIKYRITMQHAIDQNDASQILQALDEIVTFKKSNDLITSQINLVESIIAEAFNKLTTDPIFVRKNAIDCACADKLYEIAKSYVFDNRYLKLHVHEVAEVIPYKAYFDFVQSRDKYLEYRKTGNLSALQNAAQGNFPSAVTALLEYNNTHRGLLHYKRIDRPMYLCAKALLLPYRGKNREKINRARAFLDAWAERSLNVRKPTCIYNQRIKIATFYLRIIAECKDQGMPVNPDAYILKRATDEFVKVDDKPILMRIEESIKKANGCNQKWIIAKRAETSAAPRLYSHTMEHPVVLPPPPVAIWPEVEHAVPMTRPEVVPASLYPSLSSTPSITAPVVVKSESVPSKPILYEQPSVSTTANMITALAQSTVSSVEKSTISEAKSDKPEVLSSVAATVPSAPVEVVLTAPAEVVLAAPVSEVGHFKSKATEASSDRHVSTTPVPQARSAPRRERKVVLL